MFKSFSNDIIDFINSNRITIESENTNKYSIQEFLESEQAKDILCNGDIILLKSPGIVYQSVRHVLDISYDHVAVVLNKQQVLHISPPKIRILNSNLFLMKSRKPIILRPSFKQNEQEQFIQKLNKFVGDDYNNVQLFNIILWKFFTLMKQKNTTLFQKQISQDNQISFLPKNVCGDIIMCSLADSCADLRQIIQQNHQKLEYHIFQSYCPDDFLAITQFSEFFQILDPFQSRAPQNQQSKKQQIINYFTNINKARQQFSLIDFLQTANKYKLFNKKPTSIFNLPTLINSSNIQTISKLMNVPQSKQNLLRILEIIVLIYQINQFKKKYLSKKAKL